jgi:hypothetical protein
MRDVTGGEDEDEEEEEEEEYVADCGDEDDNNNEEEEEEEDAVATIVGVQVARSKPSDRESERERQQETPIVSDGLCRLLPFWLPSPFNSAMVNVNGRSLKVM